jgi:hypothetical protein
MRQGAGSLGGASLSVAPGGAEGSWSVLVDVDAGDGAFANDLRGELEVLDLQRLPEDPQQRRALPLRLTAPGRYEAELHGVLGGQRLLRARFTDPLAPERPRRRGQRSSLRPVPRPRLAPASLFPRPPPG